MKIFMYEKKVEFNFPSDNSDIDNKLSLILCDFFQMFLYKLPTD